MDRRQGIIDDDDIGPQITGLLANLGDKRMMLLRRDGQSQLVYKHAISTIMPAQPVQLYEPEQDFDD